jgi:hypothetical protein
MKFFDTLWELIGVRVAPAAPKRPARRKPAVVGVKKLARPAVAESHAAQAKPIAAIEPKPARRESKQDLYDRMMREMLTTHGIRVRKWRTSMSGVAWCVQYRDGRVQRLIEAPKPKSPMSAAIFLHEVGHHVLGIGAYKPRCLEEHHAWMYALEQMRVWNIEITDRVRTRVQRSMKYAVGKAKRRGIQKIPHELLGYVQS